VNLERAAAMDGRNSGHMVQGHVDDTGDVLSSSIHPSIHPSIPVIPFSPSCPQSSDAQAALSPLSHSCLFFLLWFSHVAPSQVIETWPDKESLFFKVKVPKRLMPYIVPKGFVAIDGTSLTVCETNVR
jgi:riboflavin synthase alpha subunit